MASLQVRARPAPNTDKTVPTDKETVKLERIQFKQNVFDPNTKGADNSKTFFKAGTPEGYDIELDVATGIVRVSCKRTGKHACTHISNANDFRELADGAVSASGAPSAPKFEAVKVAEGSFQVRKVDPPVPVDDSDEMVIPPRKRGRPRKQPAE